ncbi:uncharacterized protein SCODWIG_02535 [Saccharomycodes ludwigii]|uniref:Rho-type GTPase-activating protein 1 n=1 Tax=Saccharomycodes ludwigii TaxID=36035 RepID=A0A376B8B8_9ASCO|nr:uncharacterized protein SCODWIG_02535 [Saccharomycodes ludwigii]
MDSTTVFTYPKCKRCKEPITGGHAYELGGDRWHTHCFSCYKCDKPLSCDSDFLVLGTGALICLQCSDSCKVCGSKIDELAIILSNSNEAYCPACFKCCKCGDKITNLKYAKTKKGLYCINCHEKLLEKRKRHHEHKKRISKKDLPDLPDDMMMQPPIRSPRRNNSISITKNSYVNKSKDIESNEKLNVPRSISTKNINVLGLAAPISIKSDKAPIIPQVLRDGYESGEDNNVEEEEDDDDDEEEEEEEEEEDDDDDDYNENKDNEGDFRDLNNKKNNDNKNGNTDTDNMNKNNNGENNSFKRKINYNNGNSNLVNNTGGRFGHSHKASIDDILESTLENNIEDEKLLLNKTPLRNNVINKSPNRSAFVYESDDKNRDNDDETYSDAASREVHIDNNIVKIGMPINSRDNNNSMYNDTNDDKNNTKNKTTDREYYSSELIDIYGNNKTTTTTTTTTNNNNNNSNNIAYHEINIGTPNSNTATLGSFADLNLPSPDKKLLFTMSTNNDMITTGNMNRSNSASTKMPFITNKNPIIKSSIHKSVSTNDIKLLPPNNSTDNNSMATMGINNIRSVTAATRTSNKGNSRNNSTTTPINNDNVKNKINNSASTSNSVHSTPKKINRSLSLKSPRKILHFKTSSSNHSSNHTTPSTSSHINSTPNGTTSNTRKGLGIFDVHGNNEAETDTHTGWGIRQSLTMNSLNHRTPTNHKKSNSSNGGSSLGYIKSPNNNGDNNVLQKTPLLYSANNTEPINNLDDYNHATIGRNNINGHRRVTSASSIIPIPSLPQTPRLLPNYSNTGSNTNSHAMNGQIDKNGNNTDNSTITSTNTSLKINNEGIVTNIDNTMELEMRDYMLQLRKLKMEILTMQNTKETLQVEIDNLKKTKDRLFLEVSGLSSQKQKMANRGSSNESIDNSSNNTDYSPSNITNKTESFTSSSTNSASHTNNNNNNNNNSGVKFWRAIFSSNSTNNKNNVNLVSISDPIQQQQQQQMLQNNKKQTQLTSVNGVSHSDNENKMPSLIAIERQLNNFNVGNINNIHNNKPVLLLLNNMTLISRCKYENKILPTIVQFCINTIEKNDSFIRTEGLYRKTASKIVIESFEKEIDNVIDYNRMKSICENNRDYNDVHVLASVLKRYLRKLPIPVIPFTLYEPFISLSRDSTNVTATNSKMDPANNSMTTSANSENNTQLVKSLMKLVGGLPKEHFDCLKAIIHHISTVSKYNRENLMTIHNLALVFAPSILRDYTGMYEINDIQHKNVIMELFIKHEERIFQ